MLMAEPIRVAQVVGKMVGGGVEQVVMNYYRHVDRSKVQFDFIVDADSTLVPREEIGSLGGRVFEIPPYQRPIAYQRALVALFREERWPIVHSHVNALSVFPLRAAKRAGVPVRIAHSHSTSGRGEHARNALKWVLRRFSRVYPTNLAACGVYAGEWLFGKGVNFEIVYNAIELDRFRFNPSARAEVRTELGIQDEVLVIGHIGRFVTQKNHAFLLEVFDRLVRSGVDAVLVLAGDGPLRPVVECKVRELGLFGRVRLLGQRGDTNRLYQAFDVFCLPSFYEGLGMVAVEAEASGLPCILSDAVPEDADPADTAVFLPTDNAEVWADIITAHDTASRRDVESSAFVNYDIELAAPKLTGWYEALTAAAFAWGGR